MKRRWKQTHLDPEEDGRNKKNHFRKTGRIKGRNAVTEEKRLRNDKSATTAAWMGSVLRSPQALLPLHAAVAAVVTCTSHPLQEFLRSAAAPKTRAKSDHVSYPIRRSSRSSSSVSAAAYTLPG